MTLAPSCRESDLGAFSTTTAVPRRWSPATVAVPSIYSSASPWVGSQPAARNTLDSARIPRASKLLICGLFQKVRVLAQDGIARGKVEGGLFHEFYESVQEALAHFEWVHLDNIERSALGASKIIRQTVLPPSSVATPCLNASVSWPACVGERH